MRLISLVCLFAAACLAQQDPDTAGQREAMKKLAFLVGRWSGDASVSTGPGAPIAVRQTEEVQFKLNGLILQVEGTGRNPASGEVIFMALATISYDPAARVYRFRAFNDGRALDTELKVNANGFEWGYTTGPAVVHYVMKLNEKGEWVETGEVTVGSNPPRKTFEMTVRREK
jgi:hypothetical protein